MPARGRWGSSRFFLAVLGLLAVGTSAHAEPQRAQREVRRDEPEGRETWAIELAVGLGSVGSDVYTERLESFGFGPRDQLSLERALRVSAGFAYQLGEHLSVVFDARNLEQRSFQRDLLKTGDTRRIEDFSWSAYALVSQLRVHVDLFGSQLRVYGELGPGLGYAHSELDGYGEDHFGLVVASAVGVFYTPSWFGFLLQLGYAYAPIVDNRLGETHDGGGLTAMIGLRFRGWGTR